MLPLRYENPRPIGKGANANVYRAFDRELQCEVSFKWGLPQLSRHVLFRLRWQQEVFLLEDISSPNIVEICDHGVWQERPYMTLLFVEDTLPSALHTSQTVQRRLNWLLQLLDAISVLHIRDVIHQDINPDNILIDGEKLRLTDFSVARSKSTIHADVSEVSGTMGWCAPEQQRREHKWINDWTDIFSWGRLAHYLFVGDPAFTFFQDIVSKASAPKCLDRFDSVSVLRNIFHERISKIPSDVLQSEYSVENVIPIPISHPIPLFDISFAQRKVLDSPTKGIFGENVRRCIRAAYTEVNEFSRPSVVMVCGASQVGKQSLIQEEVGYLLKTYASRVISLDYEKTDGILQLVRRWVCPHKETHEETVERVKKILLSSRSIRAVQKEREANVLALWSRRNILVEIEVGILFFIQKIQDYAQKTPVILVMNQPQRSRVDGDGLDICSLFLSHLFAALPVLVIASIDENRKKNEDLEKLSKQGAKRVDLLPCTEQQFASLVSHDAQWHKICAGSIKRWAKIKGESIHVGDRYIDVVARMFERFEKEANESTKLFVCAIASSIRPIPLYVCREYAEELEQAFLHKILRVEDQWVVFCHSKVQSFVQKKKTKISDRLLGDLWRRAEHEDAQERNMNWCRSMSYSGAWKIVRPTLQRTMEQCFLFRRTLLLSEGMALCAQYQTKKSLPLQKGYQAFLYAQEGRDIGSWGDTFDACTSQQKEKIVVVFLQKEIPSFDFGIYEAEPWWNILMGEKAYIVDDVRQAERFFYRALQDLESQSFLWIWSYMRWIEVSFHQRKEAELEDHVLSLLNSSRQLSSVRAMSCASFAYSLFCFSKRRFDEGVQRLHHAASTAFICGHWRLWARVMSYLAAYFLGQKRKGKALEILRYKKTICLLKQISCPHIAYEFWLVERFEKIDVIQAGGLGTLCTVLRAPSRILWLELKDKICMSLHPFVPIFLREFSSEVVSDVEKEEILHSISLDLC